MSWILLALWATHGAGALKAHVHPGAKCSGFGKACSIHCFYGECPEQFGRRPSHFSRKIGKRLIFGCKLSH